jgi:autotransporter-associated beta strand protein
MFASWRKWLRSKSNRSHQRSTKASRKPGCRLLLETLEDRLAPAAHTWSGAVSNLWSVAGNWSAGGAPTVAESNIVLNFGATGAGSIKDDIAGVLNIDQIKFTASGYSINAAPGSSIGLTGAASPSISDTSGNNTFAATLSIALTGTDTIQVNTFGTTDTINGVISSTGNLTKTGAGTLSLLNTNTYGDTTINGGTLFVGATGSLSASNMVTINPGAVLSGNGSVGNIVAFGGTVQVPSGGFAQLSAASADFTQAGILSTYVTGTSYTAGADYGQLNLGAGALSLSSTSTVNLDLTGLAASGTIHLVTYATPPNTKPTVNLLHNPSNFQAPPTSIILGGAALAIGLTDFPLAVNDTATTNENTAVTTGVLTNDTGLSNTPITVLVQDAVTHIFAQSANTPHGTVSVNNNNTVTYTPNLEFVGTDSYTYQIKDNLGNPSTATVSVTVSQVDSKPTNTVPGPQTITEGQALVFSSGKGNQISVADTDGDSTGSTTQAQLSVSHGILKLKTTAGLSFLNGTADNSANMAFSGSDAAINAALNGLAYTANAGFAGSDTLVFTSNDGGGSVGANLSNTSPVGITVTNVAPTVTAPGNQVATEGISQSFSIGSFTDPGTDGPWTVTVFWGDGTFTLVTPSPSTPGALANQSHTYDDAGTYMAFVQVVDQNGGVGTSAQFKVTVSPQQPTASILGIPATNPAEGTTVTLAAAATSPSQTDQGEGFTFAWTVTKSGITVQTGSGPAFSFSLNAGRGNYAVSLVATEKNDPTTSSLPASTTITATGVGPTPTITGAPATSLVGTSISLGSTVTDPNVSTNATLKESFTYSWTVTTPNGQVGAQSGAATPNFSFTPNQPGTYFVTLTVDDQESPPDVGTATQTIVVTNVGPTVTAPNAQTATEGIAQLFNVGSFTEPGTVGPWTVTVFWGDNSFTTFSQPTTGTLPQQSHQYADAGSYNAQVQVTDQNGGVGNSPAFTVTVNPQQPTPSILGLPASNPSEGATLALAATATSVSPNDNTEGFIFTWTVTRAGVTLFNNVAGNTFSLPLNEGPGVYHVSMTAAEAQDPATTNTVTANITAANVAPTPSIVVQTPAPHQIGTQINFTGSATDPNTNPSNNAALQETINLNWSVTGPTSVPSGTGASFSFTPTVPGIYNVTLTATDNNQNMGTANDTGTTTTTITVLNVTPSVTPSATPQTAVEGTPANIDLGSFSQPGNNGPWTVLVNWGDGGQNIVLSPNGATESGNTVTITTQSPHGFAVGQMVQISGVGTAGYNGTFTILSTTPTTFTYTDPVAGLANSGGGTALTTFTIPASPNSPHSLGTQTHTYGSAGNFVVVESVTDDTGATGTAIFVVAVAIKPPTFVVPPTLQKVSSHDASELATTFTEGDIFQLAGTLNAVGLTDNFLLTVDWQDGTVQKVPIPHDPNAVSKGVNTVSFDVQHKYLDGGTFNLSPTVANVLDPNNVTQLQPAITLKVLNAAPLAQGAEVVVTGTGLDPNQPTFDVTNQQVLATFSDVGKPEPASNYRAVIDWGDGTVLGDPSFESTDDGRGDLMILGNPGDTLKTIVGRHTYAPGAFKFTIAITNLDSQLDPNVGSLTPPPPSGKCVNGPMASPSTPTGYTGVATITGTALTGTTSQRFLGQTLINALNLFHDPAVIQAITQNHTLGFDAQSVRAQDTAPNLQQVQQGIVNQIANSQDAMVSQVRQVYLDLLARDPATNDLNAIPIGNPSLNPTGLVVRDLGMNTWVQFLSQTGDEFQLRALIMNSVEYLNLNPCKFTGDMFDVFLKNVYVDGLGRSSSQFLGPNAPNTPAEMVGWKNLLLAGVPRSIVALNILLSPEGRKFAINKLYKLYLNRPLSDVEFNRFWTNTSIRAARMVILGSPEFLHTLTQPPSPTAYLPQGTTQLTATVNNSLNFSQQLAAPGTPAPATPYNFAIIQTGTNPPPSSLQLNGQQPGTPMFPNGGFTLTGAPVASDLGSSLFSVSVKDANNVTIFTQPFYLTVDPALLLGPTTLNATFGNSVSQTLVASGGSGSPYIFSPTTVDGLQLDTKGLLSGMPAATGTFTFAVTATDSLGITGSQNFTLIVT